jgi:hypothetical protein
MVKETKVQEQITVNDLAKKSGLDPKKVRRVLRKQFGGGSKKVYTWEKGDPKVDEILKALKNLKDGVKGTKGGTKGTEKKSGKGKETPATDATTKTPKTQKAPKTTKKVTTEKTPPATEPPAPEKEPEKPAGKKNPKAPKAGKSPDVPLDEAGKKSRAAYEKKNDAVNDHIKKTGKAPTTEELDAAMAADKK